MRTLLPCICFFLMQTNAFAQKDSTHYSEISLKYALQQNKVKAVITGSYDQRRYYRLPDGDGLHYGKCMEIVLESQLDSFVVLKLDAGYSLIPEDSNFQTMVITKTIEFPLYPRSKVPFNIYAMCGEIHDYPPSAGVMYELGEMADTSLLTTIKIIEQEYLQNMIGQHMVWAVADQVNKDELIKYGADSISLMRTTSLLTENNIDCNLVRESKPPQNEVNEKPAYMKVSKLYFYAGITYTIVITAGFIFLAVYSYRKRKKISV